MKSKQVIVLFVKPPVSGKVKTRLAKDIGEQAACDLYYRLADHTIQQVLHSGYPLALFFDGHEERLLPAVWREQSKICLPQQGDDLGERMAHAFKCLFAAGVEQAILIGSDIPGMNATCLHNALTLLVNHDMVIGPAIDGGYYLIGFNRKLFSAELFTNMPWSTNQVFQRTLASSQAAGLSVGLLPPLQDIDTFDNLQSVCQQSEKNNLILALSEYIVSVNRQGEHS